MRNEVFTEWKLELFGVDAAGLARSRAYTIELRDAAVSKIELVLPSTFEPTNFERAGPTRRCRSCTPASPGHGPVRSAPSDRLGPNVVATPGVTARSSRASR